MNRSHWITLWMLLTLLAACAPGATNTPEPFKPTAAPGTTVSPLPPVPVTQEPAPATANLPSTAAPTAVPPTAGAPSTATTPPRLIVLEAPQPGAAVASPVQVRGRVSVTPFESTLRGRVYDAQGWVVGEAPITLPTTMGQPGTFDSQIPFQAGADGPGQVEVAEISARDGSIVVRAVVAVYLQRPAGQGLEIPAPGARVTLPLHILARVGGPGEQVQAILRWQDGTLLEQAFTTLRGEDGRGLIVDSLDWMMESQPPRPPSQPAVLELRDTSGAVLARQDLTLLSHDDPDVRQVTLYFLLGEQLQAVQRHIVRTEGIGAATLQELLWGPPPLNLAGFETAIPTPDEVLSFPGRGPGWGPRVTLLKLTIVDGLATADFSREMEAYGGGSLRVMLIRAQIEETLKQFSTVQEVVIAVEGRTEDVLQP